jgi:phage repressor protein C with HTH and peptisase S24 domain
MPQVDDPPVYRALMKLKPEGLKAGTWAARAGMARNIFNNIREHGNPKRETIEKLLEAIHVSPVQFEALMAPVRTEVAAAGIADVRRAFHGEEPLPALPLLGSAIGGEHQDIDEHVELVELHLGEVLDYIQRPASLARDPHAYAVSILSDSMSPKFEPGDLVAVSPREPVAIGDYVIVQLRNGSESDERVTMVLIKRLVRRSAGFVELCQFNPEITFRIDMKRVAAIHKVKGTLF